MEFLNSKISFTPRTSSAIPFVSHKYPFTSWKNKRRPSTLNIPDFTKLPLSIYLSHPIGGLNKLQISANFRRPASRKNYLRKKLTEQQQVRQVSPVHEFKLNFDSSSEQNKNIEENRNLDTDYSVSVNFNQSETESRGNKFGESVLWNKLEGWVEQYKKDSEFWGTGTGPVFNIFENSKGKIKRVVVNEDEILRRSGVDPKVHRDSEDEDLVEANYKISYAKGLAKEMENGRDVIPRNSSIAKFVLSGRKSDFMDSVRGITLKSSLFPSMSRAGIIVLSGLFVVWALKGLLTFREDSKGYTRLEKEMLTRKMKARKEKENTVKSSVEVIQELTEPKIMSWSKPTLDKDQLLNTIVKSKGLNNESAVAEYSRDQFTDFDEKIKQIRAMARHAREIEKKDPVPDDSDTEDDQDFDDVLSPESKFRTENPIHVREIDDTVESISAFSDLKDEIGYSTDGDLVETHISSVVIPDGDGNSRLEESKANLPAEPLKNSMRTKLRIIKSVKEAREYLSEKHHKLEGVNQEPEVRNGEHIDTAFTIPSANVTYGSTHLSGNLENSHTSENDNMYKKKAEENVDSLSRKHNSEEIETVNDLDNAQNGRTEELNKESWIEKNFHEFDPVVKRIGVGFRDNYVAAKEKSNQALDMAEFKSDLDENELEWMKDEKLREIVFRVRDNELSGREPFYLMDDEDKRAFFSGLEKKVEQVNENLQNLHEYFHSNIENLDYGADGISLYDPPEKILPRWKVPPVEKNPEFLDNFVMQRKDFIGESLKNSFRTKKPVKDVDSDNLSISKSVPNQNTEFQKEPSLSSKTIIEGSDGSVRAGKKSGREYWQHTKKWSEGFLESYNTETDPEVKNVMKDIGKDLDRWITEKEIKEAADFMEKIPEKGRKLVQEKLDKVKREMELYGPQTVVSKYREYADVKEEDHLWWLDLPVVLCIELYTIENGEQKMGFYSLEMAPDLELDPKQYHVIGFEDLVECKNLCYIIQAHMEMLGNGNAFVVGRPPKDAFREAKSNGFSVTVIKRGSLRLNIDQTLEEVEELIVEIGSKIYHDQLMKERSVDINGLMKGVFGVTKPTKKSKRSKRKMPRRIKP